MRPPSTVRRTGCSRWPVSGESSNTLADRIVLLDGIPRGPRRHRRAALRFGADGKLYAAFDDGGDPRRSGDGPRR
jgi:glucose/arabinose dehydrogenase